MIFGKHINKYYLKYFWLFFFGIVALVFVDIANLKVPEYLGDLVKLFEAGNPLDNKTQVLKIVIGVVVTAVILVAGRILFRLFLFSAGARIEADLRKEMFDKATKLSTQFYQNNKVGTIMNYFMSDIDTVYDHLTWGTVSLIDAIFLSTYTIVKMFLLNWSLSLIAALPIILIIVWGFLAEIFMSKLWDKKQESADRLYDYVNENFMGIRVIKAFVREIKEIHEFAKVAKKNKDTNVKFVRIETLFDISITLIITIVLTCILGFGSYFVFESKAGRPVGNITLEVGDLVTFIGYFETLVWPLIALGGIFSRKSRSKASLARISMFLDSKEDIVDRDNSIELREVKGNIKFNDLSFKYPGTDIDSLKHVSLEIKQGEKIGVIGRVGSGKTTLLNLLIRLYNIEDEKIYIDGHDINGVTIKSLRESISIVPQDNILFSETIKENIAFAKEDASKEEIENMAELACISEDINKFEDKYKTIVGERGVTLSGGQKQRISIARAYLKNSPILILDDSLSAVDTKTEEQLLKNLNEYRKDKTTILISSRASTVEHLDKIIVFNNGEVEAFDTHENLLKISKTYQNMVHLQTLEKELDNHGGR